MSWVGGKLLGVDLETTGVDPETCLPVSFAFAPVDGGALGKVRTGLIDPGVPIPPETTAIHKITDEMVTARGGDLLISIEGIVGMLVAASVEETPLVGMNLRYDLTMIDACARRLMGAGLREQGWDGVVLDVLVLDRGLDRYRKGGRKLADLCALYGVGQEGAHNAVGDAVSSIRVLAEIARRYPEIASLPLDEVHGREVGWHRDWAESFSEYRVGKGEPPLDDREQDWPIAGDGDSRRVVDARSGAEPVSQGQAANLSILIKDRFDISDRTDRLDIVSGLVGRPIESTKDLTVAEFREAAKDLAVLDQAGVDALLLDAQDGRGGVKPSVAPGDGAPGMGLNPPPGTFEALRDDLSGLSGDSDVFPEMDVGAASQEVIRSTMKLVMTSTGPTVNDWLREFGLPRAGSVNDRRLRFYEFACRERAAGNEAVEAIFTG